MVTDAIITPSTQTLPIFSISVFVHGREIKITENGAIQPQFQEQIEKALKNQA